MVLIVDDNADVRALFSYFLDMHGFTCRVADSGADALRLMAEQEPALVVMDYQMPEMHGLDMLRAMRSDQRFAHIPVIVVSGRDGDLRDQAIQAGADAFVRKGEIDWDALASEIHRLIERPRAA